MDNESQFVAFPKIARLNRECVITEKIDGTNAHVWIEPMSSGLVTVPPFLVAVLVNGVRYGIAAGSRTRFITPLNDNHGFAKWVQDHCDELVAGLGVGRHYGEWWGSGIQRGYGLTKGDKRFSLFNTGRWSSVSGDPAQWPPECCSIVPVLYRGLFNTMSVNDAVKQLRERGSVAAPGFMQPEGVVAYHTHANLYFKVTVEKDDTPKGLVKS